jgi:TetR/AcrR family transcriptional repressor of nem operon
MAKLTVREKLVEAALELFHAKGFNGCGVLDITEAAGVPKGSFYNHFKSKELLALAVLEHYVKRAPVEMFDEKSIAPLQRLRLHFEALEDRQIGWRFERGCLLGNFGTEMSSQSSVIRTALKSALIVLHSTEPGAKGLGTEISICITRSPFRR